jgi:hypothetical protein
MIKKRLSRLQVQPGVGMVKAAENDIALSVVVPCANEEEVLRETNRRLILILEQLGMEF